MAVTLSFKDVGAAVKTGQAAGFPIADTIKGNLTFSFGSFTLGDLYLIVILIAAMAASSGLSGDKPLAPWFELYARVE